MPSPLGHALAGVAAGWIVAGRPRPFGRQGLGEAALFAAAAMAADLDLLVDLGGAHRGPTHSVGAAALAGLLAYLATRRGALAAAVAAAWVSHPALDWLGSDTTPPIGIMALWPFSRAHYESGLHVFHAISRRYWLPDFWLLNGRAVVRESLILLPIVVACAFRRKSGSSSA